LNDEYHFSEPPVGWQVGWRTIQFMRRASGQANGENLRGWAGQLN
jgi:hypothetical protein